MMNLALAGNLWRVLSGLHWARNLTIAFSSGRNIICMLREKALSFGKSVVTSLVILVVR